MFYGVNWIFLFSIIFMLNKIRHIKDRLKVREEMGYIVASWTIFCYAQYTLYLFAQADSCPELINTFENVYVASFWVIILRDLVVLGITWFYVTKVDSLVTSQRLKSIEDGQRETHVNLFEFSSVILSVLPYQYFKQFLANSQKHFLIYLRVIMLFKQWQELIQEIEQVNLLGDDENKIDTALQSSASLVMKSSLMTERPNELLFSQKVQLTLDLLQDQCKDLTDTMLEIFLEHSQLFLQNSFVKTPSTDKRKSAHFFNQ